MNKAGTISKGLVALVLVLFFGQMVSAQNFKSEEPVIRKLIQNEKYKDAITQLKTLQANDPKNERIDYLLGLCYFKQENFSSAGSWFEKGRGHGARYPMNHIGLGAVKVKNKNFEGAKVHLKEASELNEKSKSPSVYLEIAEAYMGFPDRDKMKQQPYLKEAELYLYKVQKLAPKNARSFVLLGQLYQLQGVEELEQMNYEAAIERDASYIYAYLRLGQLYKKQEKYNEAAEKFEKAIELDKDFAPAYREMAEMWFLAKKFTKANEMMEKYLALMGDDLGAKMRACIFKYLGEQYDESIECMETVVKDTNSILLLRLLGYSYVKKEQPDADKSLEWLNKYFNTAKEMSIIASDYEHKGMALQAKGQDSLAVLEYEKAIAKAAEKEESREDLYSKIADIYKAKKNWAKRAEYLEKYMATQKKFRLKEGFGLGQSYYMAKNYAKADSVFQVMTEKKPDLHIGWAWRAKANAQLDPESKEGLAKPYYEKVVEMLGADEEKKAKYKADFKAGLIYLGAYYTLIEKDCPKANGYWDSVLEIDPENENAKNGKEYCK